MPKRLTPRGEAAPPVEPIVTGATMAPKPTAKQQDKPQTTESGIRYVRNLHEIRARVTLTTGREIQLEPRGQREDIDIVTVEEQKDPRFIGNRDLIFEVISAEQAEGIIAKQQTNSRARENSLWDHMRTATGEPYEQRSARIERAFEEQGTVVGDVRQTGSGRFTDKNFEVARRPIGPEVTQVPGSPGHPGTEYMQSVPSEISPEEYHEFLLWKEFKAQHEAAAQAADASPEELRAGLNVTVEPVQTDDSAE